MNLDSRLRGNDEENGSPPANGCRGKLKTCKDASLKIALQRTFAPSCPKDLPLIVSLPPELQGDKLSKPRWEWADRPDVFESAV